MNVFNTFANNLASGTRNLHVSLPLALAIGLSVAEIWVPQYEQQLNKTARVLMAYGVMAAANSGPGQRKDDKDEDKK